MERYDAGLLNDFGGGDVGWWQDYIRAELERAHEFYASLYGPDALAARDARIEQLEAALRPFIDAIGRIDLSREYGENRVEIHWGKGRATAVTVASFTQALAALGTKHD